MTVEKSARRQTTGLVAKARVAAPPGPTRMRGCSTRTWTAIPTQESLDVGGPIRVTRPQAPPGVVDPGHRTPRRPPHSGRPPRGRRPGTSRSAGAATRPRAGRCGTTTTRPGAPAHRGLPRTPSPMPDRHFRRPSHRRRLGSRPRLRRPLSLRPPSLRPLSLRPLSLRPPSPLTPSLRPLSLRPPSPLTPRRLEVSSTPRRRLGGRNSRERSRPEKLQRRCPPRRKARTPRHRSNGRRGTLGRRRLRARTSPAGRTLPGKATPSRPDASVGVVAAARYLQPSSAN